MTALFGIEGDNLHTGYVNLSAGRDEEERVIRAVLEAMWERYEPYADLGFRHGFARDPDGRFWEMFLGCTLLDAGKQLLPAAERNPDGGQPDICVLDGNRRIWIEAMAPHRGDGPDQMPVPVPVNEGGGFIPVPRREAQLRITHAFWTKSQILDGYLADGVIDPDDVRVIAIGGGRFGIHVPENGLPLVLSAVFPVGEEYVAIDPEGGDVIDHGFELSLNIARRDGAPISRTAFVNGPFGNVSAVLWSRVSIGNMSRAARPLTCVHNPMASVPLPERFGVWDREFAQFNHSENWEVADILATDEAAAT